MAMTQQEILEGDKLIAEFRDVTIIEEADGVCIVDGKEMYFSGTKRLPDNKKCYHNSWDWLMLAVEKIESLKLEIPNFNVFEYFTVTMVGNACIIKSGLNGTEKYMLSPYKYEKFNSGGTLKEAVYKAVIEFIKWYNENK